MNYLLFTLIVIQLVVFTIILVEMVKGYLAQRKREKLRAQLDEEINKLFSSIAACECSDCRPPKPKSKRGKKSSDDAKSKTTAKKKVKK